MQQPELNRRWWLRRWMNRLEVDRATFYAVLVRAWQFLAGPVTMLLIARYFTPDVQGYYYTFWSLLALQTIVELGFLLVVLHVASHEWAQLQFDKCGWIVGDPRALGRLASLARLVGKWYAVASAVFVVGMAAGGLWFFSQKPAAVSWQGPWLVLVVVTGLGLFISALIALLEGCNQMAVVNRFRVLQVVTGNVLVWACIWSGMELWVTVVAGGVKLFWESSLVFVRYRRFWLSLWDVSTESDFHWRRDVWPLQWRVAVQSVFHYFAYQLLTPVLFHYHGAKLAGQMGMTWTALTAFQAASFAWVQTRMPLFGILIARKDYRELNRVYRRLTLVSGGVLLVGGALLCGVVAALNVVPHPLAAKLAERLLPPWPTVLFTLVVLLMHVPRCQGVYLRAHKQEPLMVLYVPANTAIALAVFVLGSRYGAEAAAWGYLTVIVLVILPVSTWIWRRCRSAWHRSP